MDLERVLAVPRLRARPLQGVLRALVRHPQGAARRELCNAGQRVACTLPQLLHARPGGYFRRLSHLRAVSVLTSRDNPKVKRWTKLAADARYRRSEKRALIDGPHLLTAMLKRGHKPVALLATEDGVADAEIAALIRESGVNPVLLAKGLFRSVVDAETPRGVAAEIAIPGPQSAGGRVSVFLEGVQDPSNVGAIVRTAAAFGAAKVVLDRGCAD